MRFLYHWDLAQPGPLRRFTCCGGARWGSEARVLAPVLLPTCSVTLGRSLAHLGCKFLLCTVAVLDCLCRGPGSQASGGQPNSRAIFTVPGGSHTTLLGIRSPQVQGARRSGSLTLPGPEAWLAPPPASLGL